MKNIRFITTILLIFLFSNSALAQTHDHYDDEIRRVQLILKGGMNASTVTKLTPHISGKESMKIGYNVGILADVYVSGGVFIQASALLVNKGARIKGAPLADGGTANMTLNAMYMQFPLLFAYKISAGGYSRFTFAIGPYFAYGIGGKIKGGSVKNDTFGEDGIGNKSVIGFCTEVQYETPKLLYFFGTDIGLTKMMKKTDFTANFRSPIKNYGFNLGMGYKF